MHAGRRTLLATALALAAVFVGAVPESSAQGKVKTVSRKVSSDTTQVMFHELGMTAFRNGDYSTAAKYFKRAVDRNRNSYAAGNILLFRTMALRNIESQESLRLALIDIDTLKSRYLPKNPSLRSEVASRELEICARLGAMGDQSCRQRVYNAAADIAAPLAQPGELTIKPRPVKGGKIDCKPDSAVEENRLASFQALLKLESARAIGVATRLFAAQDPCDGALRAKIITLIAGYKTTPDVTALLSKAAREDRDPRVREEAVTWALATARGGTPDFALLSDILMSSTDTLVQERALLALQGDAQGRTDRYVRDFVKRASNVTLRRKALGWLGSRASVSDSNVATLRDVYPKLTTLEERTVVLNALAGQRALGKDNWIVDVALKNASSLEERTKILFFAGQAAGLSSEQYVAFYDKMPEKELREQLIRGYIDRSDSISIGKLVSIGRSEKDPQLRKKIIEWATAQQATQRKTDPRILEFLVEIVEGKDLSKQDSSKQDQ
jgi:hypothetical protein